MHRKGQAQQFNWIFVIVSGAIILGFFTLFIFKYVELQEKRFHVNIARDFGSSFELLSSLSAGSSATLDSQEGFRIGTTVNIESSCDDGRLFLTVNGDPDASFKFRDELVFAPSSMRVDSLDLWLLPWSFPYFVGNFVLVSEPEKFYYLVYDVSSRDEVLALDIPSIFKFKKLSVNSDFKRKKLAKIVYFTEKQASERRVEELDSLFASYDVVHVDLKKEEVSFYDEGWGQEISYLDDNFILASLFSDDQESFQCLLDISKERVEVLSEVYARKAELLAQQDRRAQCRYSSLSGDLVQFGKGNYDLLDQMLEDNKACSFVF